MIEAGEAARPAGLAGLADWLRAGAAALLLKPPRDSGGPVTPALVAGLIAAKYLLVLALQRAIAEDPVAFNPWAALNGWASLALMAWLCGLCARPAAGRRFAVLCSAGLLLAPLVFGLFACAQAALGPSPEWPLALAWAVWLLPMSWFGLAQLRTLWPPASRPLARAALIGLTALQMALSGWLAPVAFWTPAGDEEAPPPNLVLTQEVVDAQPRLLADALAGLRSQQPGRVDVFALTYAPYATQDVFLRESAVVAQTLGERFGAAGRTVQLVVNPATATSLPWATPSNLRRAIDHIAARMDREEDLFFIHLTSHGGYDGKLAVDTGPLRSEPLTPQQLKAWLDAAGIRWRVISVSACYSGSWLEPLKDAGTLVMTAADATHTSYGCGSRSELTFFGRAMYVDALTKTRSFEQAHAEARLLIAQREKEAGKSDGYSNPQIQQGEAIRAQLARLAREQSGGVKP